MLGNRERERWKDEIDQRNRDRADSRLVREEARQNELADHWREERRQAHVKFMSTLNEAHRKLMDLRNEGSTAVRTDWDFVERTLGETPHDVLLPVFQQLSNLELLASERTRDLANKAGTALVAWSNFLIRMSVHDLFKNEADQATHSATLQSWMTAQRAYRDAVREELGTSAGPQLPAATDGE